MTPEERRELVQQAISDMTDEELVTLYEMLLSQRKNQEPAEPPRQTN